MDFSFSTIDKFDVHIRQSIPGYVALQDIVLAMSEYFISPNTNVYDVGCSTGIFGKVLAENYPDAKITGIEREPNFFKDHAKHKDLENLRFIHEDYFDVELSDASMMIFMFTLQFMSIACRRKALEKAYAAMDKGAGLVLCEKYWASTPRIQEIMTFLYYDFKRKNFTAEEILNKERNLRKQMHLFSKEEMLDLLRDVGFTDVNTFFQEFNFYGVLAIK